MGEKNRVDVPQGRSWRVVYNNPMPLVNRYSLN